MHKYYRCDIDSYDVREHRNIRESKAYMQDVEYLIPEKYIDIYEDCLSTPLIRQLENKGTSMITKLVYLNKNVNRKYIYYWCMYKLPDGIKYKKYAFFDNVTPSPELISYSVSEDKHERVKRNLTYIVQDKSLYDVMNTLIDGDDWSELIVLLEETCPRSIVNRCVEMILSLMDIDIVSDSLCPVDGEIGYLHNLSKLDPIYTVTYRKLTMTILNWCKYLALFPSRSGAICNLIV